MARYSNGINGPFIGKVGSVVGTTWNGRPVMRSKPKRRKTAFSPAELQQQAKFSLMNQFLNPLVDLMNLTFKPVAVQMTGYNKAFSYNIKNAIAGAHPEPGLRIDYSMVILGRGDLPNAGSPAVTSSSVGKLDFTWEDNSGKGRAKATDMIFIAVHCEELNQWLAELDMAERKAGSCIFEAVPFRGNTAHTYIGFISADGKEVSETIYLGPVKL